MTMPSTVIQQFNYEFVFKRGKKMAALGLFLFLPEPYQLWTI